MIDILRKILLLLIVNVFSVNILIILLLIIYMIESNIVNSCIRQRGNCTKLIRDPAGDITEDWLSQDPRTQEKFRKRKEEHEFKKKENEMNNKTKEQKKLSKKRKRDFDQAEG